MQDAGPRAGRLRPLVILGALSAFGPLSIDMYLPSLPSLARDLGAWEPQVQLTLTACLATQVNRRLVGRVRPLRRLDIGLGCAAAGGLALLITVAVGGLGLAGILPPLFVVVASLGLVLPNATALALSRHPEAAGSAWGVLGVLQFLLGAAVAPLVGLWGTGTALPMAVLIAAEPPAT